jgi:hypothetical protein
MCHSDLDMVVGECLEGIGDPSGRVVPVRRTKRLYGRRAAGYGKMGIGDYNDQIVAPGRYPLFNGVDTRDTHFTSDGRANWKVQEGCANLHVMLWPIIFTIGFRT